MMTKQDENNTIILEMRVSQEEFRQLRGELNDIYLFTDRVANVPSKVSLRGRNEATRYFLIPRQLRKEIAVHGKVSCQRIENSGKSIFVYVLDRLCGKDLVQGV